MWRENDEDGDDDENLLKIKNKLKNIENYFKLIYPLSLKLNVNDLNEGK